MYRDPVCGMDVDPDETEWYSKYQGETYYFCCLHCQEQFEQNPSRYATEPAALDAVE